MELPQFAFDSKPKLPDQLTKNLLLMLVYKGCGWPMGEIL